MPRRIGHQTYEVARGVVVMPIHGAGEKQDGWQVVVDDEYYQDYPLKRDAVLAASSARKEIKRLANELCAATWRKRAE